MDLVGINYFEPIMVVGAATVILTVLFTMILNTDMGHDAGNYKVLAIVVGISSGIFTFVLCLSTSQNAQDDVICRDFILACDSELLETDIEQITISVKYDGEILFEEAIRRRSIQAIKDINKKKQSGVDADRNAKILEVIESGLIKEVE